MEFESVVEVQERLESQKYISSREIATVVYLAVAMEKPILVEGPAGVGKTELAKSIAKALKRPLIRMQCYEGLDESKSLYEWEYAKQLLYTQMLKDKITDIVSESSTLADAVDEIANHEDAFFSEKFIQTRPLLAAIKSEDPVVLLIDEIDKSDPEFEAFLLELLSDFQITIPEIGTMTAVTKPIVVLTSNNYRDMSDALKRRCIHLFIDYPDIDTEMDIVRIKLPDIDEALLRKIVTIVARIRAMDLKKKPCISETIDWAMALLTLQIEDLTPEVVATTLNPLLKYKADYELVKRNLSDVLPN
ncbi:MoxR family ATPase [Desulfoluna sp.]|uniref:AAA family ATPase n=1 Tax=Desulfoluna sp. TaxID=2045199 RepID=UPI002605FCCA|nr:MoxR family ATPase [Desulfoluna sp.]